MHRTTVLTVGAVSAAALIAGGVAVAATSASSKSVSACATSKGVIRGASAAGACPKGSKKVTIAKQGKAGISHLYIASKIGPATATPISSGPKFTDVNGFKKVPAGTYLVTFVVNVHDTSASATDTVKCDIAGPKIKPHDLETVSEPAAGDIEVTGTTSVVLAKTGTFHSQCLANNTTTQLLPASTDSLTAAAVGALN